MLCLQIRHNANSVLQSISTHTTACNKLFECLKCAKYSIVCVCQNMNKLPTKTMNFKCTNFNCSHFTVHCDCDKTIYKELESSYQCFCGYKFEYTGCPKINETY